jgi:Ca-activated chloride channel family protein
MLARFETQHGSVEKSGADFADERPNDRIGLVVYASEAYTKTPVTSDTRLLF